MDTARVSFTRGRRVGLEIVLKNLYFSHVGFEVLTAVVLNSIICWDITPCSPSKGNRRLGGTELWLQPAFTLVSCPAYSSTLKVEAICSSETSVEYQRVTWRYIPRDSTLSLSHLRPFFTDRLKASRIEQFDVLTLMCINPLSLKPSGYYTYHFNILQLCILPTQCMCVFRMVLTINSDCFPKQH
jgi:hypothetical protein